MKEVKDWIWYVSEADVAANEEQEFPDEDIEDGPGFFFENEAELLEGPYETLEEAESALADYFDSL